MVGRKKCESKLMLISGNRDTERHTCDIHSQFIVILCIMVYNYVTLGSHSWFMGILDYSEFLRLQLPKR